MNDSGGPVPGHEPGMPDIPEHTLLRCVGGGSYGEVWLARTVHGQFRAVKVVHRSWFEEDGRPFEREYEGLQRFDAVSRRHPSQLPILQIGRNDAAGYFYYVMEPADDVVAGPDFQPDTYAPKTLSRVLKDRGRLTLAELLPIALALTDALDHLHQSRLVHRDIKPSNIIWHHGVPKLADIGLVTVAGERGTLVGTTGYFPEGGVVDASDDLFSLGKVLYQAATGLKPESFPRFPDDLPNDSARGELRELNEILLRACASKPTERYRSAAELRRDLSSLQAGQSLWARRRQRKHAVVAAVAILAVAAGLASQQWRKPPRPSGQSSEGLVHWWKGDGDSRDVAGNAHGKMLAGGGFVPGRLGQAFSGVVEISDQADLNFRADQPLTIALWVFPTNASIRPQHVLGKRDEHALAYQLAMDGRGLNFGPGGWAGATVAPRLLPERRWTHLAATSDGRGTVTLLVNGVVSATGPGTFGIASPVSLKLGGAGPYQPFAGYLDDVRIYHRALSPDEIAGLVRDAPPEELPRTIPPPAGLIHWWPGEGDARDVIGGANGTMPGGSGFAVGQVGQAFVGTVVVPPPLGINSDRDTSMTLELWVRPTNGPGSGHIIGKRVGCDVPSPSTFQLATDKGGLHFSASPGIRLNAATGRLPQDVWTHLGLTHDGRTLSLYVNGELSASQTQPLGPTNSAPLKIGGSGECPPFAGLTDEVSIYNRALTGAEMKSIYNAGSAGKQLPPGYQRRPAAATPLSARATNSLGMVFVPIRGLSVDFCIWETRFQDFETFVREAAYQSAPNFNGPLEARKLGTSWQSPGFPQVPTSPVCGVTWTDAKAFCAWLTARERRAGAIRTNEHYRLPTDREWSWAVGLTNEPGATPAERDQKVPLHYWGSQWPPPTNAGNFAGTEYPWLQRIGAYTDAFPFSAPVGSFPAGLHGLFDMAGNVQELCEDWSDGKQSSKVLRGGGWDSHAASHLWISKRWRWPMNMAYTPGGFRVVLERQPAAWTNSLGQVFAPVPGTDVQFCIWHTRVQDYAAFAAATGRTAIRLAFSQAPSHPAVYVSWEDAQAFCHWLTSYERSAQTLLAGMRYRLPLDWEWSVATGLAEPRDGLPADKHLKSTNAYPWGSQWPPPQGVANYAEGLSVDTFAKTSPVGSFPPGTHGLFDLGGNAWQWCEDAFDRSLTNRVLRGGSWHNDYAKMLNSSYRHVQLPDKRDASYGFRIVLAPDDRASAWTNSLGQVFVPVSGTDTLFCRWETSIVDFELFVRATKHMTTTNLTLRHVDQFKGPGSWRNPGFPQGASHPVTCVSWEDAQAFCRWLTETERRAGRLGSNQLYRLPLEAEFSRAIGLPAETGTTPQERRNLPVTTNYLWGAAWPPPALTGNLLGGEFLIGTTIPGYRDEFSRTAPVGCFPPNAFGLYDLIGNVWEICEEWYAPEPNRKPHRGGGWDGDTQAALLATTRFHMQPDRGFNTIGFRVVLAQEPAR